MVGKLNYSEGAETPISFYPLVADGCARPPYLMLCMYVCSVLTVSPYG